MHRVGTHTPTNLNLKNKKAKQAGGAIFTEYFWISVGRILVRRKKEKRFYFIAPTLIHFNSLSGDEMKILVEESVVGNPINCDGSFWVCASANRGEKVCIRGTRYVWLKSTSHLPWRVSICTGIVQDLLGCEVIADTESLDWEPSLTIWYGYF